MGLPRRLYPWFESEGWDIMLIARPKLVGVQEMAVEEALSSLLGRAGLERPQSPHGERDSA